MDKRTAAVLELCRDRTRRIDPKMKWMWGEALFGFALSQWDDLLGTGEFMPFRRAYCEYYLSHLPKIDCADHVVPGLVVWAVQCKTGDPRYGLLTGRVLDYIRDEKRLPGGTVNHLGHNFRSWFYPASLWVDSLMMFALFPALYGAESGRGDLLDFAAGQIGLYSSCLQDRETGLWRHCYRIHGGACPRGNIFWGRGNGGAIYALSRIMELLGAGHGQFPAIAGIYRNTVEGVLKTQNRDGSFNTLLGEKTYRELSATALIAAGLLRGWRLGYLPGAYREAGERAFVAVADTIGRDSGGWFLPEISGPTIPPLVFPRLAYRLIPRGRNWSYGIAAAAFAAMEYHQIGQKGG
jgi:unsaturated rhamnogalacturonyl hydrolase